jgi:Na+-transporting NADH:ubiquinone oxidoreductase subunit A
MRKGSTRLLLIISLLFLQQLAHAQATESSGSNTLTLTILAIVVLIAFFVIIQVSDNLLRIEAKNSGAGDGSAVSIFPGAGDLFKPKVPSYANGNVVTLSKGFDIKLEGSATGRVDESVKASTFAVQPPNFRGVSPIPKVVVEVGSNVKAGDHLFFDKKNTEVKYVSPVSGEVIAVNRGERRAITEVVILADKNQQYRELPAFDLEKGSREELVNFLLDTGGWSMLRQRPFDVVASHTDIPDNIFISTFDTAPLAPDQNLVVEGKSEAFQKGLDVLNKLTKGKVFLGLDANKTNPPSTVFTNAAGVEKRWFQGKHPSGNVGIQIHHTAPLTPKSIAWTLGVQEVITIGALFTERRFNAGRIVALTGAELKTPKYVRTYAGANIGDLLKDNLANDHIRIVSGDVLCGQKKGDGNFLNYYDDQITVLKEGDYFDMFGWLLPDLASPSASKALPGWLFPDTTYKADTNLKGEKRAFVVTGQYEDVLPMDVYPQHLMKAILTNDYEKMEGLGIHELVEEDIALCEFVCTSKQSLQQILRKGLDMMHEQG